MTCRLEREMVALLNMSKIRFERPERNMSDPTTLDFYLPDFETYIEVKLFHSDRIARQLSCVPSDKAVILLQGLSAVEKFKRLCHEICGRGGDHLEPAP